MEQSDLERQYVFKPIPLHIKHTISVSMILFAFLSLMGNSLVVYSIRPPKTPNSRAFRRTSTKLFVRCLATSDILSALITCPVLVIEIYVPITPSSWACHLVRYIALFLTVITMMNIFAIGIERYFAIFRPLSPPSNKTTKMLIAGAWIIGMVMTALININIRRRRYFIDEDKYTLFCSYDNSTPTSRIINIVFVLLVYYFPCIILTVLCIRILRFLKHRRRTGPAQMAGDINNSRRFKGSYMLVSLIFAFILPYLAYVVYLTVMMILKPPVSYVTDFTVRYATAVAGYSNGVLNPVIYLIFMKDARARLKGLFTRRQRVGRHHVAKERLQQTWSKTGEISAPIQGLEAATSRSRSITPGKEFCLEEEKGCTPNLNPGTHSAELESHYLTTKL
ncbi:pyroglutamylated RF-amide peptide receptor [Nematostella vectensis]|uniref:pyroglutamylated RF-amide peptide receptor n=1 Tax=Nematostella vectensis TaxID=45351 RepID=UPI0020776205|nr:pyroglutamylated RF-amide peptide receptor [Nematostella vectensis]